MRSKAKYMAIVAIVVVAILAITLVSCGGSVTEETTKWLAGEKTNATVTDKVTISDVKVNFSEGLLKGDLLKIKSLDIVSTRVINGDKLSLSLKVENIKGVSFSNMINTVLGSVLKDIKLDGISQIGGIEIILNYDPKAEIVLTGEFHGYDLNKMLPNEPAGDSNPNKEKFVNITAEEVTGENHTKETALINGILDLLDNPIYGPATFDKNGTGKPGLANIIALANIALEQYGAENFYNASGVETQYNANSIIDMIFGTDAHLNIGEIIEDVLTIAQLKMTASETQKVGGKNVYKSTAMSANVSAFVDSATVQNIGKNIGGILGALGVDLGDISLDDISGILKGEINLEAKVKVESTYTNN